MIIVMIILLGTDETSSEKASIRVGVNLYNRNNFDSLTAKMFLSNEFYF